MLSQKYATAMSTRVQSHSPLVTSIDSAMLLARRQLLSKQLAHSRQLCASDLASLQSAGNAGLPLALPSPWPLLVRMVLLHAFGVYGEHACQNHMAVFVDYSSVQVIPALAVLWLAGCSHKHCTQA